MGGVHHASLHGAVPLDPGRHDPHQLILFPRGHRVKARENPGRPVDAEPNVHPTRIIPSRPRCAWSWERKRERQSAASCRQTRSYAVILAVSIALTCSNVVKQLHCWPARSVRDEVLRGFRFSDRTYPVNGGRLAAARRRRSSIQREMSAVSAPALMHSGAICRYTGESVSWS